MQRQILMSLVVLSLTVGCAPTSSTPASVSDRKPTDVPVAEGTEPQTYDVALSVPTMNCPFDCWPKVKETLEGQPGVGVVTLAPQEDANAIDNPLVYLTLSGEFSADTSLAALEAAGFEGASVSQ